MSIKDTLFSSVFYKFDKPIGRLEFLFCSFCLFVFRIIVTLFVKNLESIGLSQIILSIIVLVCVGIFLYLTFAIYMKRFWSITLDKKQAYIYTIILFLLMFISYKYQSLRPLKSVVGLIALTLLIIRPRVPKMEEQSDV